MRGGRSATAADDRGAGLDELRDMRGELVRSDGEDGPSALDLRKPRVWLHDDRLRRDLREALDVREHPVRAESAIEPVRLDAKRLEERSDAFDRSAGEKLAVRPERNRREDRKIARFLRGDDGRLQLADVAHRLDGDEIRCRKSRSRKS